jgi:CBS domain containing-hemolysin-like protein
MDVAVPLVGGLLLIAVIIAANGYFVAQEFSFMAVDRSRLKALAEDGDDAARRALRVTGRTSFMLSGAQLGITVTGLLVGYVAEPLVGTALGTLLGGVGVPSGVGIAVGTIGVLVVSTFVQMLFGELYPKNLSIAAPWPVARRLARSTLVYLRSFGWLIWFFDRASAGLVKLFGMEPVDDVEHSANPRDLQRIVSASRDAGELPPELSVMLDRLLDFPERDVEHALVPRSRVDVLTEDVSVGDTRERMTGGHSRYPVLSEEGEIVGVVHVLDLLEAIAQDEDTDARPVSALMRPATVIPTLMRLPDALAVMVDARDLLACVVDEYGGFAGIVTVEDLVEEVVGEITDEHDEDEEPHLEALDGHAWRVRGDAPLDEVARELGHEVPEGDFETVAGLAIAELGALPREGEVVTVRLGADVVEVALEDDPPRRTLLMHVEEVAHHVPVTMRLELLEESGDESEADEEPADEDEAAAGPTADAEGRDEPGVREGAS